MTRAYLEPVRSSSSSIGGLVMPSGADTIPVTRGLNFISGCSYSQHLALIRAGRLPDWSNPTNLVAIQAPDAQRWAGRLCLGSLTGRAPAPIRFAGASCSDISQRREGSA